VTTSSVRHRLTGTLRVALPPTEAFHLFTPRGERNWVDGWDPRFLDPTADDTEPGTVFQTHAHGETTTWIVLDRRPGRGMAYARVTPGARAGTVTVTLDQAPDSTHHSNVTVTYDLTALTQTARPDLEQFASRYRAFLLSWQDAITAWLGDHDHEPTDQAHRNLRER
jgi:hypothetical protein